MSHEAVRKTICVVVTTQMVFLVQILQENARERVVLQEMADEGDEIGDQSTLWSFQLLQPVSGASSKGVSST